MGLNNEADIEIDKTQADVVPVREHEVRQTGMKRLG